MRRPKLILSLALVSVGLFTGCEETIHPNLEPADPVLVVDAWINNKVEEQKVVLTWTQPYLQQELPPPVNGASVTMSYEDGVVAFVEDGSSGVYIWRPTPTDSATVFETGRSYILNVLLPSGESYTADSRLNRTVGIDSITFKLEDSSPFFPENAYTGEFWATDSEGQGDTYWIKTYKNGRLLEKPAQLKLAYDAAFSAGGNFDGVTFIPPIRDISPFEVDENNMLIAPYTPGDSVFVEIHSINVGAFNFLNEVIVQTDRPGGFGELFATPLANVSTNIFTSNPNNPAAVGFFNVSAVNGLGKKLEP